MSVPQITVDLTPPSIGQSVEEFNAQAHIWTANLSDGFKPQANALATFVNQKAVEVGDDATAAQTARTQAQTAATNAGNSATTASTAATNAGNSATLASNKAGEASTAATTASTKAGEASASASAALASKNAAATSESNAAGSATTASTKAGEASTSATTASTKAGEASTSATTANTKAGEASASASAALASKNAAATSESNAAGSASAALASKNAAYQAKLDAEAAAAQAAGGGEPTILPGTNAQYWRGDKTWRDLFADVRAATLTGLSTATNRVIAASDTVLVALGLLQKQHSDHAANTSNPHGVTAAQVGATPAAHASATNNPHSVTAAQVGAAPSAHVGAGGTAHANATTSADGFMSSADKTKLNGIASNATANASNAELRDRSTHTGTQAQSTVTNLTSDLAARVNRQDTYATVTSGVINLGLETELYHITVSGNVSVSVSNAPSAARVVKRLVVQYSSGVVTWPASFKLPTPMPTFAAGKAYVFSIEQSPNSGVYFLVPGPEYTYP